MNNDPDGRAARLAKLCSLLKQAAAELDQAAQDVPLKDRFAALRAAFPLPPAIGEPADKAFFDELSEEPS